MHAGGSLSFGHGGLGCGERLLGLGCGSGEPHFVLRRKKRRVRREDFLSWKDIGEVLMVVAKMTQPACPTPIRVHQILYGLYFFLYLRRGEVRWIWVGEGVVPHLKSRQGSPIRRLLALVEQVIELRVVFVFLA
jgi:hypothetical protein